MRTYNCNADAMTKAPRVVGTGLVALDVLIRDRSRPTDTALGGSTGNVLAILAFLGWSAVPVARLGKDSAAQRIKGEFASLNADTRFIAQEDSTATPIVYQWPGDGDRTHKFSFSCPFCGSKRNFVPGSDTSFCKHVLEHINSTDVFYFDRVTPWALTLAEAYRERGALVMFEPSTIGTDHTTFQQAIRCCNVLKYADDRIDQLESFDRQMVDVEIQTAGAEGLRFRLPSGGKLAWYSLDALKVSSVADTAGAGDWCTAGFLYYLSAKTGIKEMSPPKLNSALRYGQALAALNCMQSGARGLARQFDEGFVKAKLTQLLDADLFNSSFHSDWAPVSEDFKAHLRFNAPFSAPSDVAGAWAMNLCCKPLTS